MYAFVFTPLLVLKLFVVFPIFGAASASTAALPLLLILTVTAIKDGVEDYRRAQVDEEVNTSAMTKLGQWRNVNIVSDPRPWYQRLLHMNPPGKISKEVKKRRPPRGCVSSLIKTAMAILEKLFLHDLWFLQWLLLAVEYTVYANAPAMRSMDTLCFRIP